MTATKECKKCGIDKPSTSEYFYRNKREKDGLNVMCKKCMQEYQANYYVGRRKREPEKPKINAMIGESRERILKNYKVGQVVKIKYKERKEGSNEIEEKKSRIKILGFYPNIVLCLKDNCRECYSYNELDQMLAKGDK